jgi:hypothetical protein
MDQEKVMPQLPELPPLPKLPPLPENELLFSFEELKKKHEEKMAEFKEQFEKNRKR